MPVSFLILRIGTIEARQRFARNVIAQSHALRERRFLIVVAACDCGESGDSFLANRKL